MFMSPPTGRSILRYGRYYDMIRYGPILGFSHKMSIIRYGSLFCDMNQILTFKSNVYFTIWQSLFYDVIHLHSLLQNVYFTIWLVFCQSKCLSTILVPFCTSKCLVYDTDTTLKSKMSILRYESYFVNQNVYFTIQVQSKRVQLTTNHSCNWKCFLVHTLWENVPIVGSIRNT